MSNRCSFASRRKGRLLSYVSAGVLASMAPVAAQAATLSNPICPNNTAQFDPGSGQDIVVPPGFKVSVFKSGLNFPTGIAFRRTGATFEVYVLESGHGLPSRCNDEDSAVVGGTFSPTNPFTPDILVFDQNGTKLRGPLGKPTSTGVGLSAGGPRCRHRVRKWSQRWPLVCDRLEPVAANGGEQQQLAHCDRGSKYRAGHAVHYWPANGRSPDGAASV